MKPLSPRKKGRHIKGHNQQQQQQTHEQTIARLLKHKRRSRARTKLSQLPWIALLAIALTIHHAHSQYKPAMKLYFEDDDDPAQDMISLDEASNAGGLEEDRSLEEYALLRRNEKRHRNAKTAKQTLTLEEASPELNSWLLNTTEPSRLPSWKKDLLKFYQDGVDKYRKDTEPMERGMFALPEFLKKTDVSTKTDNLPKIYLCSERKRDVTELPCCVGKDTECFTDGGCFCDESCQQYDDCCPDYSDTCAEILNLCLTTEAPPAQGPPKGAPDGPPSDYYGDNYDDDDDPSIRTHKDIPRPSKPGGGKPERLEPNKCCGQRPYNDGEECCCNRELVDIPCEMNPCS